MIIIHDSRNREYRSPFGAVEAGAEVALSVDVVSADVVEAVLQYKSDEEPMYTPVQMHEVQASRGAGGFDQNQDEGEQSHDAAGRDPDGPDQSLDMHRLRAVIKAPEESGLLWYRFKLVVKDENGIHSVFYCSKSGYGGTGSVIESDDELVPYQITVYKKSETPAWFKDGIVYQIFPDRFARDEDWLERCENANRAVNERRSDIQRTIEKDWYRPAYYVRDSAKKVVKWPMYGGSLRGIMERLDYLKSLGITVIYLNPIFEASTNHRYDTGNYMKIDPALGTEQDFIELAEAARARGIQLILDGVFSHTGSDSIYFDKYGNYPKGGSYVIDGAATAENRDDPGSTPGEEGVHGTASGAANSTIHGAWKHEDSPFRSWYKFDPEEHWGYKSWWGVEDLPEVIEEDPSYQKYILGNIEETEAAAGDKSDAAGAAHDGCMTESQAVFTGEGVVPHWLKAGASGWRLDVADELPDSFIRGVRKAIKKADPDGLLIGEVWEDASNKTSYGERRKYFAGDELDGTMNYPLRDILLDYVNYTISSGEAGRRFMSLAENYPRENLYGALNLIGSHDRTRIITLLGADKDRQSAVSKVKLLSTLEYALPGVPCIYYGDEAGLQGAADPENRSGFPWGEEDHDLQFHYRMLGLLYNEHPVLKDGDITMLSGNAGSNGEVCESGAEANDVGIGSNAVGREQGIGSVGPADAAPHAGQGARIPGDVLAFVRSYSGRHQNPDNTASTGAPDDASKPCGDASKAQASIADTGERILVLANRSYGKTVVDLSGFGEARCGYAIDLFTSEEIRLAGSSATSAETETSGLSNSEAEVGLAGTSDVVSSLPEITMDPLSVKMVLMLDEPPEKVDLGRSAGVICHLGSLGEQALGKKARDFIDYIAGAGLGIWQVLPVNPPGLGGSPYDSASAFAGDPGLIDMDEVPDDSGRTDTDEAQAGGGSAEADGRKQGEMSFSEFCEENAWWLHGYAAYCAIKEKLDGKPLFDWPDEYRLADPEEAFSDAVKESPELVSRILHEQYWFAAEWSALKEYANSRGVRMMGDIPMYMSEDSADVWANRTIFRMDENGRLSVHAGVPPDYFSKDGQDWGNPLYDWDELRRTGYDWWLRRIRQCAERFDILRLDHFRALSEYYAIPEGKKPVDGLWQQGPGADFIKAVKTMLEDEHLGMKLLAEDLGQLDAGVYDLLKLSGLPGMDIWQFSAYEMLAQTPETARQRAFYTGTHDNSTLAGFVIEHAEEIIGHAVGTEEYTEHDEELGYDAAVDGSGQDAAARRIVLSEKEKAAVEAAAKDIIRKIYETPASLAMLQLQDIFMLGDEARMNVPGISEGNWKWRIPADSIRASFACADDRAAWLRKLAESTGRSTTGRP